MTFFFIWTHGADKLNDFIQFAQNFSDSNAMKSKIKFEVNQSTEFVNFLDVSVSFKKGVLKTSLHSKPTDAFLYINKASNHPKHVLDNIPKGQYIRIRRICSDREDYLRHSATLSKFFMKRGYDKSKLDESINEVLKIERSLLLEDKPREKKDPQIIFVTNWHQNLSTMPSILKKYFHILENDHKTSKIFTNKPLVAFRRPKNIGNYLVKNDISPREKRLKSTKPCGNCIFCPRISTSSCITNEEKGICIQLKDGGDCQSKGLIYAAKCKKHKTIYVGHTGEAICKRFGKHKWDIYNRPENSDLAQHFHKNHQDGDMEVMILQTGLQTKEEREYHEDKWICLLQTLQPDGINRDTHQYAKDMYECYDRTKGGN